MVDLGSTVAGRSSRANGISADGKVVVGWQEHSTGPRQGAKWINGKQEILAGPNGFVGEAHGANSDASIIVGQTCRFSNFLDQSAWIWTARDGVQCLAGLAPWPSRAAVNVEVNAVSDDGRVIVGGQHRVGGCRRHHLDRSRPALSKDYLQPTGAGRLRTDQPTDRRRLARRAHSRRRGAPSGFRGYIVIPETVAALRPRCRHVLLALSAPAPGQTWRFRAPRLYALGWTRPSGPELTQLDIKGGFTWGLQRAPVHAALGR
jgi:hypothetical protein